MSRSLPIPRAVWLALVALAACAGCGASGLTAPETDCDPRDPRDERDLGLGDPGSLPDGPRLPYCQPTSR